jgi:hypothetical protein
MIPCDFHNESNSFMIDCNPTVANICMIIEEQNEEESLGRVVATACPVIMLAFSKEKEQNEGNPFRGKVLLCHVACT